VTASWIPTIEPQRIRAGDTWVWRREDLSDYPAPTWTLYYRLKNAASHIEFTASADGAYHLVTVAAATTAAYTAGRYRWVAYVEAGSERYEINEGTIEVEPAFNNASALDDRSHARKMLDAIESVLEGRATKDQEEYQIGSRSLKRTPIKDLLALRDKYRAEVYQEQLQENARSGTKGAKLVVRL
jgi:hypothetical protein